MSIEPDPYRTLGLTRGATADEVRRAYRRLVKANHPDSAGEGALPRFLAIQAAYETLAGGSSTRRVGSGGSAAARQAPRDPWRADPDRAGTARDRPGRPGRPSWGAGSASSDSGPAPTGARDGTAASGSRGRPRPPGGPGPAETGSTRPPRGSDGRAGPAGGSPRPVGERPRRDGRKRAPNKATLGSTSYDAADEEPFEPEWSGGTWYGASSGTYWTINPKEYADPRKHGPEYQRRARRRARGDADGSNGSGEAFDGPQDGESGEPLGAPPGASAAAGDRGSRPADDETGATAAGAPSSAAWPSDAWRPAPAGEGPTVGSDGFDPFEAAAHVAMSLAGTPRGFMARVGLALLGWPAIGLGLATAAGEVTGCGRFAANCVDVFGVGTWLAQLIVIAILLAVPRLAALSAVGSLVALAASVPTAVILSASGGSREPATSAAILGWVLVAAYAAGVLVALVRRRPGPGYHDDDVPPPRRP